MEGKMWIAGFSRDCPGHRLDLLLRFSFSWVLFKIAHFYEISFNHLNGFIVLLGLYININTPLYFAIKIP